MSDLKHVKTNKTIYKLYVQVIAAWTTHLKKYARQIASVSPLFLPNKSLVGGFNPSEKY